MFHEGFAAPMTPEMSEELARRANVARGTALTATSVASSGHPGGSLSSMEMYTLLFSCCRLDPSRPSWPKRDRIVVSHGHTSPGVYAAMAQAGLDELAPNSYKMFRFGSKPGILIRLRDGSFKALSARCTHLDCTVQYKEDTGQIWCACHNGFYDLEGRNVSGPPPRPLERFEVVVKGDKVFVRRGEST